MYYYDFEPKKQRWVYLNFEDIIITLDSFIMKFMFKYRC